jgi:hypothetical protein
VRVRRALPRGAIDLTASLTQVELNVELSAGAFAVEVPPSATPITLDDLRAASPLAPTAPQ